MAFKAWPYKVRSVWQEAQHNRFLGLCLCSFDALIIHRFAFLNFKTGVVIVHLPINNNTIHEIHRYANR